METAPQAFSFLHKFKDDTILRCTIHIESLCDNLLMKLRFQRHYFSIIGIITVPMEYWTNKTLKLLFSSEFAFILPSLLISSIYVRRKYWICENLQLPVFDGFTCYEMSWTRRFLENVCLSVWSPKFYGSCISRT